MLADVLTKQLRKSLAHPTSELWARTWINWSSTVMNASRGWDSCFKNDWKIGCSDWTIHIINPHSLPKVICRVIQLFYLQLKAAIFLTLQLRVYKFFRYR